MLTTSAPENDRIFVAIILQNALAVKYGKILNELDPGNNLNARKSMDDAIYDGAEIEDMFDDYEDSGNDEPVDVKKLLRRMSPDEAIFRLSDRIGRRAAYDRSTPYKLFPLSTSSAHSAGPTAPFCSKPSER